MRLLDENVSRRIDFLLKPSVHVAEQHRREIPDEITAAAHGEGEPDRRILKMLGARRSNSVATTVVSVTEKRAVSQS